MRIHGDQRAVLALHGPLSGHLDIQVDCEFEIFAWDSEGLAEVAEFFAVAVYDDVATAVGAAEESVVAGLNARAADDVAGRVEGVSVIVGEHLLGDLADVADEVGRKAVAGVEAALLVEGLEFGEFVAMGGDEGLLVRGDVLLEGDWLVLGRDLKVAEGGLDLVDGDVKALGDEGQVGVEVFDLFAEEVAGDGGIVVDEQAAFAIEEFAARGEDGNLADAVGFGERTEVFSIENLEAPETGEKDGENERDKVLD